jgi:hypothetical protein
VIDVPAGRRPGRRFAQGRRALRPGVASQAHRESDGAFRRREEAVLGRQLVILEVAAAQESDFQVLHGNVGESDVDVRAGVEGEERVNVAPRDRFGESVGDQELEDVGAVHLGRGEVDDDAPFRGADGLGGRRLGRRRLLRRDWKRGEEEK